MKVLYIHALYSPYIAGGAEISLKLLVEGMKKHGHDVAVLSMAPENKGLQADRVAGVKVYRAGLINSYWPFNTERQGTLSRLIWHYRDRYNRAMAAYVREVLALEQPDVVSCHNLVGWSISVWDAVHQSGIPIVQVLHDMYLLSPDSTMFRGGRPLQKQDTLSKFFRYSHRKKSGQLNAVVAISQSILDRFVAHGYFRGIPQYVIHNAREIADPGRHLKRDGGSALVVGYMGTLLAVKGVEWLIRKFKASDIDGQLLIAGSGKAEDTAYFKALATGDPRISFVGHVNPAAFLPAIDVLAVPSLWEEPLGMVAIEGLANHLPVVASNRGGLRETVVHGLNGFLCDPEDPDSLGRALTTLWRDTGCYKQMAEDARSSVADYLSAERMAAAYEKVLNKVIMDKDAKNDGFQ